MHKYTKYSLRILAILVGLYLVLMLLFVSLVKSNVYKPFLYKKFKAETGRELQINGPVSLSLFPWLGLKVNDVIINNPKNFRHQNDAAYFAKIGTADVRISLLALLSGKVQPKKVILKNTTLNLILTANHSNNWQFEGEKKSSKKQITQVITLKKPTPPANQSSAQYATPKHLAVSNIPLPTVVITDANIHFFDAPSHNHISLSHFNLRLAPLKSHQIKFKTNFIFSNKKPKIKVDSYISGEVLLNWKQHIFTIKDLQARNKVASFAHLKTSLSIILNSNIVLNLTRQQLKLTSLTIRSNGFHLTGVAAVNHLQISPAVAGSFNVAKFQLGKLLQQLQIPIAKNQIKYWNNASLHLNFSANSNAFDINNLKATLGQSTFAGSLHYTHSKTNHGNITFNLQLNQLNLDHYQVIPSTVTATKPVAVTKSKQTSHKTKDYRKKQLSTVIANTRTTKPALLLPITTLRHFNWSGTLNIGSLTYRGVTSQQMLMTSKNHDGEVSITPLRCKLAGGSIAGSVLIQAQQSPLKLQVNLTANDIKIGMLQRQYQGMSYLNGVLNIQTKLQASGNTFIRWMRTLNGQGKVAIANGDITFLNLQQEINKGLAFIGKKPTNNSQQANGTLFHSLTGSYSISHGLLHNSDLVLKSKTLGVKGSGIISIPTQTMHYRILAYYEANPAWQIPLILVGHITNPKIQLNLHELGKSLLKTNIRKRITDTIHKFLGKDIDLKNFF